MQKKVINPYFYIIISFLAVVLVGTLLLWLPFSVKEGNMQFIDALFMSTSAVCVTGLATVNIAANFTLYGKIEAEKKLEDLLICTIKTHWIRYVRLWLMPWG